MSYAVTSAGTTGCSVNASTGVLTYTTAGSCVVRATAAQTTRYGLATADVTFVASSLTCAQGGACKVGDTGPGGGVVFYVGSSVINAVTGISSGGKYLEYSTTTVARKWCACGNTAVPDSNADYFGSGAQFTKWIEDADASSTAADYAANLDEGGQTDWFLPTIGEFRAMYSATSALTGQPLISRSDATEYWTSNEVQTSPRTAWRFRFSTNNVASIRIDVLLPVRPIRAFSSLGG
jgi:hypothetical protein